MLKNLVMVKNNQVVVSSKQVAEKFGKKHCNVVRDIKNILNQNSNLSSDNHDKEIQNYLLKFFKETTYKAGTGKSYVMYLMNRDGFSLLTMGFTGAKALAWKIAYINAYNEMEAILRERQKPKQISLIEQSEIKYVKPCDNAEYMKQYAAVQAYLTVANDMFKDLTVSRTLPEHEGVLKTAVEVFARMAWSCSCLQDVKLELYPALK